jgi:hypothetical protein
MWTALEHGVRGGIWFSLIDKVYSERNLQAAFAAVAKNHGAAGVDRVTIEQFATRLSENLEHLHASLQTGSYVPQAVRRVWIPKPGTNQQRPLGIPTVRDRVVQAAVRNVVEPIFERDFAEQSYGFRPGRSCQAALARVDELLKAGYTHVVDADLKSYFDTIPHDKLMDLLRQKVADGRVLALIEAFLKAGILDGLEEWTPEEGSPQGSVISPLLSNIYLDPLDHRMALGLELYVPRLEVIERNLKLSGEQEARLDQIRRDFVQELSRLLLKQGLTEEQPKAVNDARRAAMDAGKTPEEAENAASPVVKAFLARMSTEEDSPPFSSHLKMWWVITAERPFFRCGGVRSRYPC